MPAFEKYDFSYLDDIFENYVSATDELLEAVGIQRDGRRLRDVTQLSACDELDVVMC